MVKFLKQVAKGAVMGLANIIPGVSGGTMAVVMGIYDKLIHSITHLRKEFKESIKFLFPILVGLILGIVGLSYLITMMFERIPVQTNLLFIGLIIGGLPMIFGKLKETEKKVQVGNVIAGVLFFALVVGLAFVRPDETVSVSSQLSFVNGMKLFGVGVVASATMVIPGVSGSMIMLLLGYYNTILAEIKAFVEALRAMDGPALMHGFGFFIPFGLGVLIGIVLIAKLIEVIFEKAPNYAYCAILGLIFASPIAVIAMSDLSKYNLLSVGTGLIGLALGYFIALKLGKE
jgi:putative membrane protein